MEPWSPDGTPAGNFRRGLTLQISISGKHISISRKTGEPAHRAEYWRQYRFVDPALTTFIKLFQNCSFVVQPRGAGKINLRKVRYWLLLRIAQRPKAFKYGAGILIACTLMLATVVAVFWLDRSQVAQRHATATRIFQALVSESTELLDHLHTHEKLDCGSDDLTHLNSHLLQFRYLREIGLMDEERRLVCSTATGRLQEPVKGDYPVHISASGLELLSKVPLVMAQNELEAMILLKPPFNVAVSPFATDEIYASADAVWLRGSDGLILLQANVGADILKGMHERATSQTHTDAHWHGAHYELVTTAPGTDLVLQTQRRLGAVISDSGLLLPALLAASLLIAVLATGTLSPYINKLSHLRNRIGFLCDEGHLALMYQPIFDLTTMQPVGCEVLARLKEGKRVWMPDQMIPAIQQAGLEYQFDHAVTRKSIHELATHLPAQERIFDIALNYFPESVRPDHLVPVLTQALQATSRQDLKICVEITEHSLSTEVIAEAHALKDQGFQIAVDDFGTGYANLKSVTQLSPDILKIDRSFVHELEKEGLRANLIPEIVNIARAVDAQIIAEGIESLEQAQLLAAAGARYGQGYALGRPMEMTRFIAFMAQYK